MGKALNKILKLKYAQSKILSCIPGSNKMSKLSFIMSKFATPPFDGNAFLNQYVEMSSIGATGTAYLLTFYKGYLPTEYLEFASIGATGVIELVA